MFPKSIKFQKKETKTPSKPLVGGRNVVNKYKKSFFLEAFFFSRGCLCE